jgi:hypothetical protein
MVSTANLIANFTPAIRYYLTLIIIKGDGSGNISVSMGSWEASSANSVSLVGSVPVFLTQGDAIYLQGFTNKTASIYGGGNQSDASNWNWLRIVQM